jgi:hypothetical protein
VSPRLWYRSASGLLILFALGHQFDFRRTDPLWGVDFVVESMKSVHFQVDGMSRSYWDFFSGFGFFITVLLLFVAVLSWQLGGLPKEMLQSLMFARWTFALSFVVITFLNWRYFFIVPLVSSALVAVCLLVAAWSAGRVSE